MEDEAGGLMQHGGIEMNEGALEDLRGLPCGSTDDGAIVLQDAGEGGHEMVAIMPFGPGTWIYLYTIQTDAYGSYAVASTEEMK